MASSIAMNEDGLIYNWVKCRGHYIVDILKLNSIEVIFQRCLKYHRTVTGYKRPHDLRPPNRTGEVETRVNKNFKDVIRFDMNFMTVAGKGVTVFVLETIDFKWTTPCTGQAGGVDP